MGTGRNPRLTAFTKFLPQMRTKYGIKFLIIFNLLRDQRPPICSKKELRNWHLEDPKADNISQVLATNANEIWYKIPDYFHFLERSKAANLLIKRITKMHT